MNQVFGITIVGLIVVFTVLAILMTLFYLLKLFSKEKEEVKIKKEVTQAQVKELPKRVERTEKVLEKETKDEEIIAAITAAIHMYTGLKAFKIIKVKKLPLYRKSNWGRIPPVTYWRVKKNCK